MIIANTALTVYRHCSKHYVDVNPLTLDNDLEGDDTTVITMPTASKRPGWGGGVGDSRARACALNHNNMRPFLTPGSSPPDL